MSPTERARDRRLLIELSRINNDYGVLQRETLRDLARSRHELSEARGVLGSVAHDLRTPLQAVIGFAEFLLEEDLDPEQRELAERILRSGQEMSELTEDLLSTIAGARDVARLEEPVDLAALVREVSARFNLLTEREAAPVTVVVSSPTDLRVSGDATKLRRVLENLVTNALKFSPEDSPVRVALTLDRGTAVLTVTDRGPGIDPSEQRAVFETFFRSAASAGVPGVGLGLPIVRQIVEQHGGTVEVESLPGTGSTFVVRLAALDTGVDVPGAGGRYDEPRPEHPGRGSAGGDGGI